ncbi:MAG: thermonuclease family protein [Minisyncoccia bacterium]
MQKWLITGLIVVFLALAVQDGFLSMIDDDTAPLLTRSDLVRSGAVKQLASLSNPTLPIVIRVIDGDTIIVLVNGAQEKIRLIGVDTPETVDPRGSVQCFGEEASEFTRSILVNQVVRLESDASQDDRDKYGRLLRYVFLGDTLINKELISLGYGHEYTYRRVYKYQKEFKDAEMSARNSQEGLWSESACKD